MSWWWVGLCLSKKEHSRRLKHIDSDVDYGYRCTTLSSGGHAYRDEQGKEKMRFMICGLTMTLRRLLAE